MSLDETAAPEWLDIVPTAGWLIQERERLQCDPERRVVAAVMDQFDVISAEENGVEFLQVLSPGESDPTAAEALTVARQSRAARERRVATASQEHTGGHHA